MESRKRRISTAFISLLSRNGAVASLEVEQDPNNVILNAGDIGKYLLPYEKMTNEFAIGIKLSITTLLNVNIKEKRFKANYFMLYIYTAQVVPETHTSYVEFQGIRYHKLAIQFMNTLDSEMLMENIEVIPIRKDENTPTSATVRIYQSWTGCFRISTSQTVSNYPMDSYNLTCTLNIPPSEPNFDKYYFGSYTLPDGLNKFAELIRNIEPVTDEWEVFVPEEIQFRGGSMNWIFYQLGFRIERKFQYYFLNGFFITFVLVSISFTCFGLEPSDLANRLNLVSTTTLTIVALKMALHTTMPISPKINALDAYVNCGIAFCFFFMIVLSISQNAVESPDRTLDLYLATLSIFIWLAMTLLFLWVRMRTIFSVRGQRVSDNPSDDVLWHGKKFQ